MDALTSHLTHSIMLALNMNFENLRQESNRNEDQNWESLSTSHWQRLCNQRIYCLEIYYSLKVVEQ